MITFMLAIVVEDMVAMNINGKRKYFGSFEDEDEAGRVALEKAKEYGKPI